MIEKLKEGTTMITLGGGTVLMGNVKAKSEDKPFGIFLTDLEQNPENSTIIAMDSNKAIASYMMGMVRFLEAYVDETTKPEIQKALQGLKNELEPLLGDLATQKPVAPVQSDISLETAKKEYAFKPGDRVVHLAFGAGSVHKVIQTSDIETYEVKYDDSRHILVSFAESLVAENATREA